MYKGNTEVLSWDHCCSAKTVSIKYSECVSVVLIVQYANACTILYHHLPVWFYPIFSHYLINGMIFVKKLLYIKRVCFDFLNNFFLKHYSLWEEFSMKLLWIYIQLHVKYLWFLSDFNQTWIFLTDNQKISKY
jgi:hypothetical protein